MFRSDRVASWEALRLLGMIATTVIVFGWGFVLLSPMPSAPSALEHSETGRDPAEQRIVDWLTPGPLKIEVHSSGLISSGNLAVAVLSVNGGPPQPYRVGDELADGVSVKGVGREAVVIDKAGEIVQIAVPELGALPAGGITRVPTTR